MSTYIMSDIHGDYKRFCRMLKCIDFDRESDKLYILGDIIDRGAENYLMLFSVMELVGSGSVELLKGNHEYFMQMYMEGNLSRDRWICWGGANTLEELEQATERENAQVLEFIRTLPHYKVIDMPEKGQCVLTHAGFCFDYYVKNDDNTANVIESIKNSVKLDEFNALVSKDIHFGPEQTKNLYDTYMIVGHQPTIRINEDSSHRIYKHKKYMCIDSGNAFRRAGGRLSCYRLEDGDEFYI